MSVGLVAAKNQHLQKARAVSHPTVKLFDLTLDRVVLSSSFFLRMAPRLGRCRFEWCVTGLGPALGRSLTETELVLPQSHGDILVNHVFENRLGNLGQWLLECRAHLTLDLSLQEIEKWLSLWIE